MYAWPDALEKAQLADRVLRERLDHLGLKFDEVRIGVRRRIGDARRARGHRRRISRKCSSASACAARDQKMVERFTREIVPLVLNGPPSVTGFAGGRPKVEDIVAYWPALVDKSVVTTSVTVGA